MATAFFAVLLLNENEDPAVSSMKAQYAVPGVWLMGAAFALAWGAFKTFTSTRSTRHARHKAALLASFGLLCFSVAAWAFQVSLWRLLYAVPETPRALYSYGWL